QDARGHAQGQPQHVPERRRAHLQLMRAAATMPPMGTRPRSRVSSRPWFLGPSALAIATTAATTALGACGDTQLVLDVSRDATAAIPKIRVYAAVGDGKAGDATLYVADDDPRAEADVSARDLLVDPYRVMLRPAANLPAGADLEVAVLGFAVENGQTKPLAF